jgi:hypothetical protein
VDGTPAFAYEFDTSVTSGSITIQAKTKFWVRAADCLPLKEESSSSGDIGGTKVDSTNTNTWSRYGAVTVAPPT